MFLLVIKNGWSCGDLTDGLTAKANDPKQCAKIYNRVKLVSYRNCINEHDALHILISRGKL